MIRSMFRWLAALVLLALIVAGGAYYIAGRGEPPHLSIDKPDKLIGQGGFGRAALASVGDRT